MGTFRALARYFIRGSLVVAPLAITVYVVVVVFTTLDQLLPLGIPGLGILITVALITLVGALTSNVVGRTLVDQIEKILTKLPLVKLVYSSIKDLVSAFAGDKKRFDRPVAVTLFPGTGAKALGFVTRDSVAFLDVYDHVAVYLPQSYNFAGNLLVVPSNHVELVDTASSELMTFIVSGGVSGYGVGQSIAPPAPDQPR